jgi:hypothetical protein
MLDEEGTILSSAQAPWDKVVGSYCQRVPKRKLKKSQPKVNCAGKVRTP